MPRAVVLGVALSVLATACALVEAPPPPGTVMARAQVTNTEPFPVELAVKTRTGVLTGAAQPASLAANATAPVIFYLPLSADWWITVNGTEMFPARISSGSAANGAARS